MLWAQTPRVSLELVLHQKDPLFQFSWKNYLSLGSLKLKQDLSQLLFLWINSSLSGVEEFLESFTHHIE
jgi:hypothetical protein